MTIVDEAVVPKKAERNRGKKRKSSLTTIALYPKTKSRLESLLLHRYESYDALVNRIIDGITDVYVEFVLVDNELPQSHSIIFQLGTDKNSLYLFDGQETKPITLAETQKLLKQAKPFLCITEKEASATLEAVTSVLKGVEKGECPKLEAFKAKLEAFVDCQS